MNARQKAKKYKKMYDSLFEHTRLDRPKYIKTDCPTETVRVSCVVDFADVFDEYHERCMNREVAEHISKYGILEHETDLNTGNTIFTKTFKVVDLRGAII